MFKLLKGKRNKSAKRQRSRNTRVTPSCERLERRDLMAANVWIQNGVLNIDADDAGGSVTISENLSGLSSSNVEVRANSSGGNTYFRANSASVDRIVFQGSDNRDIVYNNTSKPSTMHGGAGNDYLRGGSAADFIYGEAGRDTLIGRNGNDFLYGAAGRDYLYGNSGNDYLSGGSGDDYLSGSSGNDMLSGWTGNDRLYGGSGNDTLRGSYHDDQLFGGSGTDYLNGGSGNDVLKGESGNDRLYGSAGNDRIYGGSGADFLHGGSGNDTLVSIDAGTSDILYGSSGNDSFWVDEEGTWLFRSRDDVRDESSFESANNLHFVDRFANGADKTLNGDRIADPNAGTGVAYRNFRRLPLFADAGPSERDIDQGALADCWLMAGLGAAAQTNPNSIRQTIVDLGDGTYAVGLGGNFYRVDADLPATSSAGTSMLYATPGVDNSIWVPLVEKAYAFFRTASNSYAGLNFGWSSAVFTAISGWDAGVISRSFSRGLDALNHIASELNRGRAVVTNIQNAVAGSGLVSTHAYIVERVNFGWVPLDFGRYEWMPLSVTLRNPWGTNGAGANNNFVTVAGDQLVRSMYGGNNGIHSAWAV